MAEVSPVVSTFVRRLAAHVVGQRVYLSYGERAKLVETIGRYTPGYSDVRLQEDLLFRNVDMLRTGLGAVADEGASSRTYALVAAIQVVLADNWLDQDDRNLVHWVGESLGFEPERVERALELADGPTRPIGAAPVSDL